MSRFERREPGSGESGRPAALVIAHPGHELRLFGWMAREHPIVFVLTDGSGHSRQPRLECTTRLLCHCGAIPGSIYGRFSDAELYALILRGDASRLCQLAAELADQLSMLGVGTVVADGLEGYNPSHDLCQYIARAAARLAEQATGRRIECYQYAVVGPPDDGESDADDEGTVRVYLDAAATERKLGEARDYPGLEGDVQTAVTRYGDGAFGVERLRAGDLRHEEAKLSRETPFYESYGEKRVASGHYGWVIRYREHVRPLARALESLGR